MAQTTYLLLDLVGIGESVGTWGVPLNSNFNKIDILAGEINQARGASPDLNTRLINTENEITTARGSHLSLGDRLNVMLGADGSLLEVNLSRADNFTDGVTKLSAAPAVAGQPIAVGDNDTRILSQLEKDGLTIGGNTSLHSHLLTSISDVLVGVTTLNTALNGAGATVTSANLNDLTDGSEVAHSVHVHPNAGLNYKGFSELSVTPLVAADPIAIGDNDPRVLSQAEHDLLTGGSDTVLHSHLLVNGAADLTVSAVVLNQLTSAGASVSATNLDQITDGSDTALHIHDSRYYTETEINSQNSTMVSYIDTENLSHDSSASAHLNDNLTLGDITIGSATSGQAGAAFNTQAHASDVATTPKLIVKNNLGANKFWVDASGNVECQDLMVNGTQTVVDTTTLSQAAVATDDLTVNGNTVLGNNNAVDTLVVNTISATIQGALIVDGAITTSGTVDGVDIAAADIANIAHASSSANPHSVTLTQVLSQDGGTNATTGQIENLTNGLNADLLHSHDYSAASVSNADSLGGIPAASYIRTDVTTTLSANILCSAGVTVDGRDIGVDGASLDGYGVEIVAARAAYGSVGLRLDNIDSTHTGHEADNANPHTVTLTQVIAADVGTGITVSELETLSDGSNADALHTHASIDSEISGAKNSAIYGVFATVDARLEGSESILNGHTVEITNARGINASIDARLDIMESDITSNTGNVAAVDAEIVAARGGESDLDTRLNLDEAALVSHTSGHIAKFVHTEGSASNSWIVVHGIANDDVIVQCYDNLGISVLPTSIDRSISGTLTISLPISVAGNAIVMG